MRNWKKPRGEGSAWRLPFIRMHWAVLSLVVGCALLARSARPQQAASPGGSPPLPAASKIVFRDVAAAAGITPLIICGTKEKNYILEIKGTGGAWFDYDNDGLTDLYIANGSTMDDLLHPPASGQRTRNYLFRNLGNGSFEEVAIRAGVAGGGWGNAVVAADYNNDGFVDLFVTNFGPNVLFQNNGDGTFKDVTKQAGIGASDTWHTGAAFGDYDRDGDLDLYVAGYVEFDVRNPPNPLNLYCNYRGKSVKACGPRGLKGAPDFLFRNDGNGAFTDVTAQAGVADLHLYYGLAVAFEDLDGDEWPDIIVTNDANPNYFYRNKRDGTFEEVGLVAGIAYNGEGIEQSNMGLALGDMDNDGWTDLFITTFSDDNFTLFRNEGKGLFADISYPAGLGEPTVGPLGFATFFFDYNNDGWKDLFCVNGHVYPEVDRFFTDLTYRQAPLLFENMKNTKFRSAGGDVGIDGLRIPGRGGAYCDFDNDGDLDVFITAVDDRPLLLRNEGGNTGGRWLQIRTIGTQSNRDGIGARVKVVTGNSTQYDRVRTGGTFLSGNDLRLHFGLGPITHVDLVEVYWPSGTVDRIKGVETNQLIIVEEGKGSVAGATKVPPKAPSAGKQ